MYNTVTHIQAKAFAGIPGGGGGGGGGKDDSFKKCFLISIYFNVKLIVLPNILHL